MKAISKEVRYVSGVQASGRLHLGNYFGAIAPQLARQDKGSCFFFIADLHSLTSVFDKKFLQENIYQAVLDYLGLGLDFGKAVFFRQSDVPEVTELAWILSCVSPMGLLERCHAYKDKTAKGLVASVGLFTYPILMAADILLYQANRVTVGKDQIQHLEVARDIAEAFNRRYGNIFILPEAEVEEGAAVVPGTDGQKMSKSRGNTIPIFGTDKELEKAVMGIVTDSKGVADPKEAKGNAIYEIYRLVATPEETTSMADRFQKGGYGYGDAKKELLRVLKARLGSLKAVRDGYAKQGKDEVEAILQKGAAKAREAALPLMKTVRKAVGLREMT